MRKRGMIFVGLDVIGDQLTEINVTSPTGIRGVQKPRGARCRGAGLGQHRAKTADLSARWTNRLFPKCSCRPSGQPGKVVAGLRIGHGPARRHRGI